MNTLSKIICGIAILFASDAIGQTANYQGRIYTPENFPKAYSCNCPMCQYIRSQWAESTPVKVDTVSTMVDKQSDENDEYETRYREEVRTVKETRYRKVCTGVGIFKKCTMVPYTVDVQKTVRIPYKVKKAKAPKPEPENPPIELKVESTPLLPTPLPVVKRILQILKPSKTDVVVDAGCGDGRFLIEASTYGCRAIGVEIDPNIVQVARQRIRASGSNAMVFEGDALKWDYSNADTVIIYQYPDLTRDIVRKVRKANRRIRIASYMHDIPGLDTTKYTVNVNGKLQSIYVGTIGGEEPRKPLTFGL